MEEEPLDQEKLRLEIKKLKTPWFRNLEFWKVVVPTVAILASLYFTIGQGFIDFEKKKLELQKEQLKLEILQFARERSKIEDSINISSREKALLQSQIIALSLTKDSLQRTLKSLFQQKGFLSSENESLKEIQEKDRSFYEQELRTRFELEQSYLQQLSKTTEELNNYKLNIASMKVEIAFLEKKSILTSDEKSQLRILQSQAEVAERLLQMNQADSAIKRIKENLEENIKKINKMSSYELQKWFDIRYNNRK